MTIGESAHRYRKKERIPAIQSFWKSTCMRFKATPNQIATGKRKEESDGDMSVDSTPLTFLLLGTISIFPSPIRVFMSYVSLTIQILLIAHLNCPSKPDAPVNSE